MRLATEEDVREGEDDEDDEEDDEVGTGGGGATGGRKEKSSLEEEEEEEEGSKVWNVSKEVIDGCVDRFFLEGLDRMTSGLFLKLDFLILCSVRKSVTSPLALLYFSFSSCQSPKNVVSFFHSFIHSAIHQNELGCFRPIRSCRTI